MYGRPGYAYLRPPRVGSFWDDLGSVATFPFRTAAGAIDDFLSVVPGGGWVKDAYNQGATWLGDMARDPWGSRILWAITSGLTPALAQIVGPQIATALWALPGALRGECVGEAYVKELTSRITLLANVYGPNAIPDAVTRQVTQLVQDTGFLDLVNRPNVDAAKAGTNLSTADALKKIGASPNQLAAKFNVRADAAALATNLVLCETVHDVSNYDPATGANPNEAFVISPNSPLSVLTKDPAAFLFKPVPRLPDRATASDVLTAILTAQNAGVPEANLADLKQQYQELLTKEQAGAAAAAVAANARVDAAHGLFSAAPLPPLLGQVLTLTVLTAPLWATVLYLRKVRA